ncbi:Uncharacterised protein [Vibrio cholerae]|nr:Uncharacterised protein [Vibrio cholerae]
MADWRSATGQSIMASSAGGDEGKALDMTAAPSGGVTFATCLLRVCGLQCTNTCCRICSSIGLVR